MWHRARSGATSRKRFAAHAVWLVARCQEKDFTITSPDLNPIEQVFSKLKHLLRKIQARSYDAILAATGKVLGTSTPQECSNYLKNCGYGAV